MIKIADLSNGTIIKLARIKIERYYAELIIFDEQTPDSGGAQCVRIYNRESLVALRDTLVAALAETEKKDA